MHTSIASIQHFHGSHAYLSNFWPWVDGHMYAESLNLVLPDDATRHYPTVEHAYQAAKVAYLDPPLLWEHIGGDPAYPARYRDNLLNRESPVEVKRLGRAMIALRPSWTDLASHGNKEEFMRILVRQKFCPISHPDMWARLDATGDDVLIEGNTHHDNYWGRCNCLTWKCANKISLNRMGNILMNTRDYFRTASPCPADIGCFPTPMSAIDQTGPVMGGHGWEKQGPPISDEDILRLTSLT